MTTARSRTAPAAQGSSTRHGARARKKDASITPIRVLIVDDDPEDIALVRRCLEGMSAYEAEAEKAGSLEETQAAIAHSGFDVALIDFHLGDDTGTHVMRELGGRGGGIALIFLTGEDDAGIKRQALESGALHVVSKDSLAPEILENAIHSSLYTQAIEARLSDALVELERATRSRADFFARIGHDLKTPLNSVIGYAEALSGESLGPLGDPRYRDYAGAIREAGGHLLELIDNLIHFSVGDNRELAFAACDLNELAASAIRMTRPACEKRGHALETAFAPEPVGVECQPPAITQAIINLLTNAIKYTPPKGEITVSVRKTARHAEVAVKDNGIGMSRADLTIALEPFGRVQLPPESAQDGTGLGLHIVREIMARHKGQLDVTSAPGKGTTAVLRLPLKKAGGKKG